MRNIKEIALIIENNAKKNYGSVNKMLVDNGFNRNLIDNMKREKPSIPNIEVICKITELLNIPLTWLLMGENQLDNVSVSGTVSGNAIIGSNNISGDAFVGSNNKSSVSNDKQVPLFSDEINEIIRIYENLDVKKRHQIISLAFKLEDEMKESEKDKR